MNQISKLFFRIVPILTCVFFTFSFPNSNTLAQADTSIDQTFPSISKPAIVSFKDVHLSSVSEQNNDNWLDIQVAQNNQENESNNSKKEEPIEEEWEPPIPSRIISDDSFWSRLVGLSRRGSCNNLNPPLIALMPPLPQTNEQEEAVLAKGLESTLALTLDEHPTFWFYVPEQIRNIEFVEFMMQDERDEAVFENPIKVKLNTSGIVSFELPAREKPLENNKSYHWYFSVVCDSKRPSRNPSIDGWIKRVQLEESRGTLALATSKEQIEFYASSNIWYEMLKLLAEQNCLSKNNSIYAKYWTTILHTAAPDIDLDSTKLSSYCSSKQKLQAVYDSPDIANSGYRQSPTKM